MLYPITLEPIGKDVEKSLREHPEFDLVISGGGIEAMHFIALCYDRDSEMVSRYPSIKRRKKEVLDVVGIDDDHLCEVLTVIKDKEIIDAVFKYLFLQDDRLWMSICANGDAFLEYMRETAKPLLDTRDDKQRMDAMNTKAKALEQMEVISSRIDGLMAKFTGGDDDLAKNLNTFRRISPEAVAKLKLNV